MASTQDLKSDAGLLKAKLHDLVEEVKRFVENLRSHAVDGVPDPAAQTGVALDHAEKATTALHESIGSVATVINALDGTHANGAPVGTEPVVQTPPPAAAYHKATANALRSQLKIIEDTLRALKYNIAAAPEERGVDKGESCAQTMLAVRHVEDARMRCGKIIQYLEGGVSIFDKPKQIPPSGFVANQS